MTRYLITPDSREKGKGKTSNQNTNDRHTAGKAMKKAGIAGGLIAILLVLPLISGQAVAGEKNGLETAAIGDFDFVVLAKSSSTTVTADIAFPLAFEFIPVLVVGDGTGAFSTSVTRNTTGEIIYLYQRFPGARVSAFNIGITPVTIRRGGSPKP